MSNKYPGGIITSGANAGYSVFFNANSSYLDAGSNAAFAFGTGAYTVEFWLYQTSAAASGSATPIVTCDASSGFLVWLDGTTLSLGYWGAGGQVTVSNALSTNVWTHIAISRSSTSANQTSIFINGTRQANGTNSQNYTVNGPFRIAGSTQTTNSFRGYIGNVRVVKGTAVYDPTATSINVPTQLFNITNTSLLTCNSPAIVDQSSNAFSISSTGTVSTSTFTPFVGTQLVPNPNTLANTQGVWTISQAAYWMSQNKWPMPPSYPLQSLRFNSADSAYLNRTPAGAGSQTTWTWSGWFKKTTNNSSATTPILFGNMYSSIQNRANFTTDEKFEFIAYNGAFVFNLKPTQVFRDVGAWYHFVLVVDSTNATSSDRIRIYVNGTRVTAFDTATYPTQNANCLWNGANVHQIGAGNGANYFDGYMSNITFVDGQALTPSSFGANDPNTGVWSPVPYSGTYGTNGFRLSFQDNTGTTATTLGKDYSGNGNNWTPNNFSVAAGSGNDSLTDGPTNWGIDYGNGGEVRGNYCTWNPLNTGRLETLANGNLDASIAAGAATGDNLVGTIGISSGKWYWETVFSTTATPTPFYGYITGISVLSSTQLFNDIIAYSFDGTKVNLGSTSAYGATWVAGDVIGVALDMTAGTIAFYKNGVSQGTAISGLTGTVYPSVRLTRDVGYGTSVVTNFGQRPFAYPAPSGFKVLCTTNLPMPAIGASASTLASKNFDVSLYTGTGAVQSITNSGSFQPDFVWLKNRNSTEWHSLFDSVRGALLDIRSNSTNAEITATGTLTSFNSNGFSLGTDPSSYGVNTNTFTYAAWQWKANGAGSSNTSGSITSTVSANTTAGIAVVTWTGNGVNNATIGHGLGVAPKLVITKRRDAVQDWVVYTPLFVTATSALALNSTSAGFTTTAGYISTFGSSTLTLTQGSSSIVNLNTNAATYVAYCFAEVAGFSKIGSYTGNGSTDGPFVYCGFRPRFIFFKRTDSTGSWNIFDTARNTYNATDLALFPNLTNADTTQGTAGNLNDILSNGFKLRGTGVDANASGGIYIFMAFAESPFNYSRAR